MFKQMKTLLIESILKSILFDITSHLDVASFCLAKVKEMERRNVPKIVNEIILGFHLLFSAVVFVR